MVVIVNQTGTGNDEKHEVIAVQTTVLETVKVVNLTSVNQSDVIINSGPLFSMGSDQDISNLVENDDPRLSDPRPPTEHEHAEYLTTEDLSGYATNEAVNEKADKGHNHDGIYAPAGEYLTVEDLPTPPDLSDAIREGDPRLTDARTPTEHNHAIGNITGLQGALDGKADDGHTHDDRYYTESEVNTALAGKANASHTHDVDDLSRVVKTVNGEAPDGAGNVEVTGDVYMGAQVPVGKVFFATRSNNSSATFGSVAGREYALGLYLGPCAVDRVGIEVIAEGAGSFRIGLRPITASGIGAAVVDAAFDAAVTGKTWVTFPQVALNGFYALTWVSIRSSDLGPRLQRSSIEQNPNIVPLAWASDLPATGHGPAHAILNTDVMGVLPAEVTPIDAVANQESGSVPLVAFRRSA